jgi:hypothetical protein
VTVVQRQHAVRTVQLQVAHCRTMLPYDTQSGHHLGQLLTNRAGAHDAIGAAKALCDHTVSTGEADTGASCGQAIRAGCAWLVVVPWVEAARVTTLGTPASHAKACSTHTAANTA